MNDLLIIGAGSGGGIIVNNLNLFSTDYKIIGFLDDDPAKINKDVFGHKVLGNIDTIYGYDSAKINVALGIAFPSVKKRIYDKIKNLNFHFPSFVSKNAWLSPNVKIGKGVIIYPGVSINYNSVIEDFVVINMNCALGHDSYVSKFTSLAPGVSLGGHTKIMEECEIGIGASTIQNITIGKNAVIGGNAMVIRNVKDNEKIIGVPGKLR